MKNKIIYKYFCILLMFFLCITFLTGCKRQEEIDEEYIYSAYDLIRENEYCNSTINFLDKEETDYWDGLYRCCTVEITILENNEAVKEVINNYIKEYNNWRRKHPKYKDMNRKVIIKNSNNEIIFETQTDIFEKEMFLEEF